ncbi:MAG TPA: SDR family oxidoreductase [Usitatibacter sp.]|jgi:glucose 1-dehydrogenase|nr:SDR family oxidoreductase [Usitatibacter sp.]
MTATASARLSRGGAGRGLLEGQFALVTGASSGIGAGVARCLAAAGATVGINYHGHPDEADAVVREIETLEGGRALAMRADVSIEAEVEAMVREFCARFGRLDILVANAGIQVDAPIDEMTGEMWDRVIGVNLRGYFLCAREAVRRFMAQEPAELSRARGKIVFMSSVHEVIPWAGHANYASSKGGVMMFMKTLAQEVASRGIRVNSIAPGAIRTPINRGAWETPQAREKLLRLIPYGRIGEPEDIGKAAAWLCSEDADYVTGTTLFVDGGMTLYPEFRDNG